MKLRIYRDGWNKYRIEYEHTFYSTYHSSSVWKEYDLGSAYDSFEAAEKRVNEIVDLRRKLTTHEVIKTYVAP